MTTAISPTPFLCLRRDDQNATRTFGQFIKADGTALCQTLELPWQDNQADISCIPAGPYLCTLRWSPEHGKVLYWITGVPNRSDVEIHIGNEPKDTKGCVLCGLSRDGDAVDNSTIAFGIFMAYANNLPSFPLVIMDPVR